MTQQNDDDKAFLLRIANDDPSLDQNSREYRLFVKRYREKLVKQIDRYVASGLLNQSRAPDVLSEALLMLSKGHCKYKGKSGVGTWLYSLVYKRAVSAHRGKKDLDAMDLCEIESMADDLESEIYKRPDDYIFEKRLVECVREAFKRILAKLVKTEPDRAEILNSYVFSELSVEEIAQKFDSTVDAIKKRIRRVMAEYAEAASVCKE